MVGKSVALYAKLPVRRSGPNISVQASNGTVEVSSDGDTIARSAELIDFEQQLMYRSFESGTKLDRSAREGWRRRAVMTLAVASLGKMRDRRWCGACLHQFMEPVRSGLWSAISGGVLLLAGKSCTETEDVDARSSSMRTASCCRGR